LDPSCCPGQGNLKDGEIRNGEFRGKEMRVAYQPSFSAFASSQNAELDWWFADLTAQERRAVICHASWRGIDPGANSRSAVTMTGAPSNPLAASPELLPVSQSATDAANR